MDTFANPFAFLLLGWSSGFAASVAIHFIVKVWSTRHVDRMLDS